MLTSPSKKYRPPHIRARLLEEVSEANSKCTFFRLPPELRNQIYEMALVTGDDRIVIDPSDAKARVPALGHVCAQLRHESADAYLKNEFAFPVNSFDIEPWFVWNRAMRSYLALRSKNSMFKIMYLWGPMPSNNQESARKNLSRLIEHGFTDHPQLLDASLAEGTIVDDYAPVDRSLIKLFLMAGH